MQHTKWTRILVALAATALLAGTAVAATKAKKTKKGPALTKVTGELTKTTTKKGKLTQATIKDADGKLFYVVLDRQGAKLAKALAGKKVETTGRLAVRGKGKARRSWLRVKTFKEAAPPPAAEPAEPSDEGGGAKQP